MIKQGVKVTNEKIMGFLVEMDEQMRDMDKRMATKDDLQLLKGEILEEIEPIRKAVDKDAATIYGHTKRISYIERKLGIAAK